MAFVVGEQVVVVALNRSGEVVEARGQQYRVRVGGLVVACRGADLRAADTALPRRKTRTTASPPAGPASHTSSSIDLHGMTTLEAREALLRHIDAALRAGHAVVEVVHGIGTGKVRAAVQAALTELPSVRKVRPHPTNRGVTIVDL